MSETLQDEILLDEEAVGLLSVEEIPVLEEKTIDSNAEIEHASENTSEITKAVENLTASLHSLPKDAGCFAYVRGEAVRTLPNDLYIPPEALEIILEIFEGPLDLLLYLIKKHNLDILNIPVAEITRQYMVYVEVMTTFRLELAADYLEMAALLAEIKSRMLLPRHGEEAAEEVDPRAELVRRLQEYERFKQAALDLDALPREGRELFMACASMPKLEMAKPHPQVNLQEVLLAFKDVLKRADMLSSHTIEREALSVREHMTYVLSRLEGDKFLDFVSFLDYKQGRFGVVVTFLAVLELVKELMVELVQNEPFGPIYVRAAGC